MAIVDEARERIFHNPHQIYTETSKEVQYRPLWLKQNDSGRKVDFNLKDLLQVLVFEPHPCCWEKGAYAAASPEYQAALLKIARLINSWTGIEIVSRRLIIQQVTRCLATRLYTVIVYEPIRRVTINGSICKHVYKYELEFDAV